MPVRDLKRSIEFFTQFGFAFNPQFTDPTATRMILSEETFVMLLAEPHFKDFTKKQICDTRTFSEGIFALEVGNRAEVDELVKKALAVGGTHAADPMDHGFMYVSGFYDLDGHYWEVFHMDETSASK